MQSLKLVIVAWALVLSAALIGCNGISLPVSGESGSESATEAPATSGEPSDSPATSVASYEEVAGNVPAFSQEELSGSARLQLSELDGLGRCGAAFALLGPELLPDTQRGDISDIKPSGWHGVTYDFIEHEFLYNRCHLVAFSLCGSDDRRNLITGTHSLNNRGMLPFEQQVLEYMNRTGNHVAYRVTPVFQGDELVARSVQMEARSVEDGGRGVSFNVSIPNVQPGVIIDYVTGLSYADAAHAAGEEEQTYVINLNTGKFHYPDCDSVSHISERNKKVVTATRTALMGGGYEPCGSCRP